MGVGIISKLGSTILFSMTQNIGRKNLKKSFEVIFNIN
jgi:hypothetical protein